MSTQLPDGAGPGAIKSDKKRSLASRFPTMLIAHRARGEESLSCPWKTRSAGITAISEYALQAVGPLVACTLWTRFSKEQPRHRLLRPRRDWVARGTRPWRLRLPACVDK